MVRFHLVFSVLLVFAVLPVRADAGKRQALAAACAGFAGYRHSLGLFLPPEKVDDIIRLCGGQDTIAASLTPLLSDPSAGVRRNAAATLGFRDALLEDGSENYTSTTVERQKFEAANSERLDRFNDSAIPALAARIDDKDAGVRLAVLQALEALTWSSQDAPWEAALAPLSRSVASADPAIRLASLHVLAYMPTDVSSLTSSLRSGLHGTDEERDYALAAITHAAQTNRARTFTVFLSALASSDSATHRQASADLRQAVMPLWSGNYLVEYSLPNWENDNRLKVFYEQEISNPVSKTSQGLWNERHTAEVDAEPRLLAALVKEASDPSHEIRYDAVFSLERIGGWVDMLSHVGIPANPAWQAEPEIVTALGQAEANLPSSERTLAKRLRTLHDWLAVGPQDIY